jgi:hypothetical protein
MKMILECQYSKNNIGNILYIIGFSNLKLFCKNQCAFYLIIESLLNTMESIQQVNHYYGDSD